MHTKIVENLTVAHRMMEHVLTLIRLQADILHREMEAEEFEFLRKAIGYMHNFPGLIHHPAEELIAERLQKQAPGILELCIRLADQHKQFNILEITLLKYIKQAQNGDEHAHGLIKKLCNTYCMEYFNHIAVEEKELLSRAISFLKTKDWLDIGMNTNLAMDPLADPNILKLHENLYDYILSTDPNLKSH